MEERENKMEENNKDLFNSSVRLGQQDALGVLEFLGWVDANGGVDSGERHEDKVGRRHIPYNFPQGRASIIYDPKTGEQEFLVEDFPERMFNELQAIGYRSCGRVN